MAKKTAKKTERRIGSRLGMIGTLLSLLDWFQGPDSMEADAVRDWLVEGINGLLGLTPETKTEFDDDALRAVLKVVQSDAWPEVYLLVRNVLEGKYSLKEAAEPDDAGKSLLVGKRREKDYTERRFGVRTSRIKETVLQLAEDHGEGFTEASTADQAQMVIDALAGGLLGRKLWAARVGEGRDWESFFNAFAKFLELIIPLFLAFI